MTRSALDAALLTGDLRVEGVLTSASNVTTRVGVLDTDGRVVGHAVYKPIRGERPLHDFPDGTLAGREVAAHLISEAGGWGVVPLTVLRDGPFGPGSVQAWIGAEPPVIGRDDDLDDEEGNDVDVDVDEGVGDEDDLVDDEQHDVLEYDDPLPMDLADERPPLVEVLTPAEFRSQDGWLPILQASDEAGRPLIVAHRDEPSLAAVAVLDAVLNNADRKAAHLARDADERIWCFDHGLTCHTEPKLRTLLWGWAGTAIPAADLDRLETLDAALDADLGERLATLVTSAEVEALRARVRELRTSGVFPPPPQDRTAVPWPLW